MLRRALAFRLTGITSRACTIRRQPRASSIPYLSPLTLAVATIEDFQAIDIRVGTVLQAEPFPEARKPSLKLVIDFGPELGLRRSSAQITTHYSPETLVGRQVVAVVNFPERRIAGFASQVLVLGAMVHAHEVVLLNVDAPVPDGSPIA